MRTKTPQALYLPAPRLNQLHILRHIASAPDITQAELAHRCGLSVAMVNNYMKELCHAGLLEYWRKSSKNVSYHLTVAGRESADATHRELVLELVKLFAHAKEKVREIILRQTQGDLRRVVLYGSCDLAELAFHALESANVNIVGVCDHDPARVGREWCGREVLNPSQIRFMAPDTVVIACQSQADDIHDGLAYLQDRGIRLIRLDSVGVSGLFDKTAHPSGVSGDPSISSKMQAL